MTTPSPKSNALGNFFLLLASLVISTILSEVLLRLLGSEFPKEIRAIVTARPGNAGIRESYIGHLHRANSNLYIQTRDFGTAHRTDDLGFRNRSPWPQRADIVAVGDSLTFGYGVALNQAWPELINQALPEKKVVNLGLIGAGPEQYLRLYERYGRKLGPKLVLVGFFARNDFWDAELFDRWEKTDGHCNYMVWRDYGRSQDCGNSLKWKIRARLHDSYLFNLSFGLARMLRRQAVLETESVYFPNGTRLELNVGDFADKAGGWQPGSPEFKLVLGALQKLNVRAAADGAKLLIVLQPSKEEVYLPLLREDVPDPTNELIKKLEKSAIDYLNLTPVFRAQASKGEKLFFETDGHPNAAGYRLIAEGVLERLKRTPIKYDLTTLESRPGRLHKEGESSARVYGGTLDG